MHEPTVARLPRRRWLPVLALAALAVALPLAGELLDLARATDRRLVALSPATLLSAALLAFAVGALIAAGVRRSVSRRSALLGGAVLSLATVGGGLAGQASAGAIPAIPPCHVPPAVEPLALLRAETYVDGQPRGRLDPRMFSEVGAPLATLFADLPLGAAEDLGVEELTPAGAEPVVVRHCRALVSGSQVTAAVPEVSRGVAGAPPLVPAELPVWRGSFDWWVSADGALVGASFVVGGHPADAWPSDGLRGALHVQLGHVWQSSP